MNQTKREEILGRLPEEARRLALEDPARFDEIVRVEIANRKKYYPSIDFVPNIGQERALRCLSKRHLTYHDYPHKIFILGGNGAGKTADLAAVLLPGMCLGVEFVNRSYCNWDFFRECAEIRQKRQLYVRLVCDSKDMKEHSGSLYQQIAKWIPTAQFKDKTGDFFQTVVIGNVVVDVKTHDMKVTAQAGPDYDAVIFNEPPPEAVYDENVSRTRGKGRVFVFCTPLDAAAYLEREVIQEAPEGEIYATEVSLWDNCIEIEGNRGQLTRKEIEKLIRDWSKNPDTLQARVYGKFAHLAGAIFKAFREDVHVVEPFRIDKTFTIYHVCDPHLVKPPFALWIAVNALGMSYVVAEYPNEPWDTLKGTSLTIRHFCKEFEIVEAGQNPHFEYISKVHAEKNIGDPNLMGLTLPNSNRSIKAEYALSGRIYDCKVPDSLELGHDKIRELLFYDIQRGLDSVNFPKLQVFNTCRNTIRSLREYGIKRTSDQAIATADRIDKTWECPIACLRYFAMKNEGWIQPSTRFGRTEYDEIDRGRNPYYQEEPNYEEVLE